MWRYGGLIDTSPPKHQATALPGQWLAHRHGAWIQVEGGGSNTRFPVGTWEASDGKFTTGGAWGRPRSETSVSSGAPHSARWREHG